MLCPARFFLEGVPGVFCGFTSGQKWTGWATPFFSREVGLQIADALRRSDSGADEPMDLRYDAEADAFVLHDPFAPDEATLWEAVHRPDAPRPLYPIGTWMWTWEEVEDDSGDAAP